MAAEANSHTKMPKVLRDLQVEAAKRQLRGLPINVVLEKVRQIAHPESNPEIAASKLRMAKAQDHLQFALKMGRTKVIPFRSSM